MCWETWFVFEGLLDLWVSNQSHPGTMSCCLYSFRFIWTLEVRLREQEFGSLGLHLALLFSTLIHLLRPCIFDQPGCRNYDPPDIKVTLPRFCLLSV